MPIVHAYCLLPTAFCHLLIVFCPRLLTIAYYLPHANSYCLLPTSKTPAACHLLPILRTAYCLLPTENCLVPTACHLLPSQLPDGLPASCLICIWHMMAAKHNSAYRLGVSVAKAAQPWFLYPKYSFNMYIVLCTCTVHKLNYTGNNNIFLLTVFRRLPHTETLPFD